jgi:hypothetical protein
VADRGSILPLPSASTAVFADAEARPEVAVAAVVVLPEPATVTVPDVVNGPPVAIPPVATEVTVPLPPPPLAAIVTPPPAVRVRVMFVPATIPPPSNTSAIQFVELFGSIEKIACWPFARTRVEFPLTVQVVGVIVTVVAEPVVWFTSLVMQFGTPSVAAVGRVTATETEPTYSTRAGSQSVGRIVSVEVVPVTGRPSSPGWQLEYAVAAPPEVGVEHTTCGTESGLVGAFRPAKVPDGLLTWRA